MCFLSNPYIKFAIIILTCRYYTPLPAFVYQPALKICLHDFQFTYFLCRYGSDISVQYDKICRFSFFKASCNALKPALICGIDTVCTDKVIELESLTFITKSLPLISFKLRMCRRNRPHHSRHHSYKRTWRNSNREICSSCNEHARLLQASERILPVSTLSHHRKPRFLT